MFSPHFIFTFLPKIYPGTVVSNWISLKKCTLFLLVWHAWDRCICYIFFLCPSDWCALRLSHACYWLCHQWPYLDPLPGQVKYSWVSVPPEMWYGVPYIFHNLNILFLKMDFSVGYLDLPFKTYRRKSHRTLGSIDLGTGLEICMEKTLNTPINQIDFQYYSMCQ